MVLRTYLAKEFEHTHEREMFSELVSKLKPVFETSEAVLVGNFSCEGEEVDAALFKDDAIIIIEMKAYSGKIEGGEEGEWNAGDVKLKNPYQQARGYKYALLEKLDREKEQIFGSQKSLSINIGHISAVVVFRGDIDYSKREQMPGETWVWFFVTDLKKVNEQIRHITSTKLRTTVSEREKILKILHINDSMLYHEEKEGKKRTNVLLMTIGTGVGEDKEKKIKNLAHGIMMSIIHINPDKIVFFGSEDSEETVKSVGEQYKAEKSNVLPENEFILIKGIDNFDDCFGTIKSKVEELKPEEVIIDYTSGTKTMTMSAGIAAMLYNKQLVLVSGKRSPEGIVIPGTEKPVVQNIYAAYDKYLLNYVKTLFNSHRFDEAKNILGETVMLKNKELYEKLIEAYAAWDKFDLPVAERIIELYAKDFKNELGIDVMSNKEILHEERYSQKKYCVEHIADLIENAKRRGKEGKFDDAVARLYRAIDLAAQLKLLNYNINTSDVDIQELKKHLPGNLPQDKVNNYKKMEYITGKIIFGLKQAYNVLNDLGDSTGKDFNQNNEIQMLLNLRNASILAHGLHPISSESYEKCPEIAMKFLSKHMTNLQSLMKKAVFPVMK